MKTAGLTPHPLPSLAPGRRTLYALVSDEGEVLTRSGRWSRELRAADLRDRVNDWTSLQRSFGGTIWRVVLSLHSPAIGQESR